MSIRNQNWYNLQSTRRYPLDENSTGIDDANEFIRDDILVDCHIRFPNTYGTHVYIQGITVSAGLVTVVFGASETLGFNTGMPLAVVSLIQPVAAYTNYAVTGLVPGVSGWVVFGPGIETAFIGRYTTVKQTLISPRCARSYRPLPVPTLGKLGLQDSLQGVISVLGQLPVKVRYAADAGRIVKMQNGEKYTVRPSAGAIVIELDAAQITENYNPLALFVGPCGQRPESGTCPKTPIESINGIAPDCLGNIELVFENFDTAVPFSDCGGVDIVSANDLQEICDANKRKRPERYSDECCAASLEVGTEVALQSVPAAARVRGLIVKTTDTGELWKLEDDLVTWSATDAADYCSWPDPTTLIPDIIVDELPPEPAHPGVTIPTCVDFSACAGESMFTVRAGQFNVRAIAAPPPCPSCISAELDPETLNIGAGTLTTRPTYATTNAATLNLTTFNNTATDWALGKTITAEINISPTGIERNGGIVLNYRRYLNNLQLIQTTFVAVVLDATRGAVRVLRYTNNAVTVEATATMQIKTSAWCRLSATPVRNGNNIAINVYAEEITTGTADTATMVVQIAGESYGELLGAAGLMANQSFTHFNKFTITE